jgi:hypothetical protein
MVGDQRDNPWRPTQPVEVPGAVQRVEAGVAQRCGVPDVVEPGGGNQRFDIAGLGEGHGGDLRAASHSGRVPPPLRIALQQRLRQVTGVANERRQGDRAAHWIRLWRGG